MKLYLKKKNILSKHYSTGHWNHENTGPENTTVKLDWSLGDIYSGWVVNKSENYHTDKTCDELVQVIACHLVNPLCENFPEAT